MVSGLSSNDIESLRRRFNTHIVDFSKNQTIISSEQDSTQVCFIISGLAYLCTEDDECNRSILRFFRKGEYITSSMILPSELAVSYIMAKYPTKAVFFNRDELFRLCSSNREWSTKFMDLIKKQSSRDTYINSFIMHGKTIRSKLIVYFRYESSVQGLDSFHLPIPFTDLAEYLGCDRSAIMKELASMKADGLITGKNRDITLTRISPSDQF